MNQTPGVVRYQSDGRLRMGTPQLVAFDIVANKGKELVTGLGDEHSATRVIEPEMSWPHKPRKLSICTAFRLPFFAR